VVSTPCRVCNRVRGRSTRDRGYTFRGGAEQEEEAEPEPGWDEAQGRQQEATREEPGYAEEVRALVEELRMSLVFKLTGFGIQKGPGGEDSEHAGKAKALFEQLCMALVWKYQGLDAQKGPGGEEQGDGDKAEDSFEELCRALVCKYTAQGCFDEEASDLLVEIGRALVLRYQGLHAQKGPGEEEGAGGSDIKNYFEDFLRFLASRYRGGAPRRVWGRRNRGTLRR